MVPMLLIVTTQHTRAAVGSLLLFNASPNFFIKCRPTPQLEKAMVLRAEQKTGSSVSAEDGWAGNAGGPEITRISDTGKSFIALDRYPSPDTQWGILMYSSRTGAIGNDSNPSQTSRGRAQRKVYDEPFPKTWSPSDWVLIVVIGVNNMDATEKGYTRKRSPRADWFEANSGEMLKVRKGSFPNGPRPH